MDDMGESIKWFIRVHRVNDCDFQHSLNTCENEACRVNELSQARDTSFLLVYVLLCLFCSICEQLQDRLSKLRETESIHQSIIPQILLEPQNMC